jgi:nicotinate-nucleotide adenylyltransferase
VEGELRIALFGGTFDPIHNAHLAVAREARDRFLLDEVLFVPAARPPHKGRGAAAASEHRYRMVELACTGEKGFTPSRLEEAGGKSFSIRTIERVKAGLAPAARLFFLIGADAFAEIGAWYRSADVLRAVEFIVVARPGHDYGTPPGARVHRLDTVSLPVSSSDIRARLAAGLATAELPPPVLDYIRRHGLYGAAQQPGGTTAP